MKKRFLDRVHNIMNRGKFLIVGCVVAGTMAVAKADVVAYDAAVGSTTWDFSSITAGIVGVLALGIAAGATIFGIRRGWTLVKGFFR